MTNAVAVIPPGRHIIVNGTIDAIVLEVCVGQNLRVQYRIVYWDKAERNDIWIDSYEVSAKVRRTLQIGFSVEAAEAAGGTEHRP